MKYANLNCAPFEMMLLLYIFYFLQKSRSVKKIYILYPCNEAHGPRTVAHGPQILREQKKTTTAPNLQRKVDSPSLGFTLKKHFALGIAIPLQVSHFD